MPWDDGHVRMAGLAWMLKARSWGQWCLKHPEMLQRNVGKTGVPEEEGRRLAVQEVESRHTKISLHLCKHMRHTQARTHAHSPARCWHSCGVLLAEDLTAAALASLAVDPPSSNSFPMASPQQPLIPEARGLCPDHWGSPGPWALAGSPGSRLDVGCTSHVDWARTPGLVSPGLRVSAFTTPEWPYHSPASCPSRSQCLLACLSVPIPEFMSS